jgi:hypothetical protein
MSGRPWAHKRPHLAQACKHVHTQRHLRTQLPHIAGFDLLLNNLARSPSCIYILPQERMAVRSPLCFKAAPFEQPPKQSGNTKHTLTTHLRTTCVGTPSLRSPSPATPAMPEAATPAKGGNRAVCAADVRSTERVVVRKVGSHASQV